MQASPPIDRRYWATLFAASVFGTNTGDYAADAMGIGHLAGLPFLGVLLGLVFLARAAWPGAGIWLFWAAIIVIRTAATNIGDAFRDAGIGFGGALPIALAAFVALVWLHGRSGDGEDGAVKVNGVYWVTMLTAGVLGTVGGDAASFAAGLTPFGTAIVFGALAIAVVAAGTRRGVARRTVPYWTALALIRTTGTGLGDGIAHAWGLGLATVLTGAVFAGLVVVFNRERRQVGTA